MQSGGFEMERMELMKRSKAVADLAWNAVKVSDPTHPGMYIRHADVEEGDHHYARGLLNGNVTAQEYSGVLVDPALIHAANDLVDFLQHHVGWGDSPLVSKQGDDAELGIASLIQYQNRVREHLQMGVAGERAEAGMERLLLDFAGTYAISNPATSIQIVREKLDPLFEDGLRLSDHQKLSGGAAPNDPQLDRLARQMLDTSPQQQRPTNIEQVRGPRADDPWEMHA
jgi:hypothetical protein